jgi:transcriptional regulator with XRE-family HTH domain
MRWGEKPPSQAKLAEKVYVSVDTIESYEQNKRFPSPSVFEALAKALKLTEGEQSALASALSSTREARRGGIATDTAQIPLNPSHNNDTVISMSRDFSEATKLSHTKWKLTRNVTLSLLAIFVLVFGAYALIISPRIHGSINSRIPSSSTKPVLISGKVLCMNNEPVVGIWADVFQDNSVNKNISGYGDLRAPNSNGSEVTFVKVLSGNGYNLHVGCGGSTKHWKGTYTTELGTGPVHDNNTHFFFCHPLAPDYGACDLQY